MSLALFGDRKSISALITPRGMYFHSTPLPLSSFLRSKKDVVGWRVKEDYEAGD